MQLLTCFIVTLAFAIPAKAKPSKIYLERKSEVQKQKKTFTTSEVELAIKRLKYAGLKTKSGPRKTMTIQGVNVEKWILLPEKQNSLDILLYLTSHYSDAEIVASTLPKNWKYAISGGSLLVLKGGNKESLSKIDQYLSAFSGEE